MIIRGQRETMETEEEAEQRCAKEMVRRGEMAMEERFEHPELGDMEQGERGCTGTNH
jgi:hypothetical protein